MTERNISESIDRIQVALADPDAPWYGSDLVPLVADTIDDLTAQLAAAEKVIEAAQDRGCWDDAGKLLAEWEKTK